MAEIVFGAAASHSPQVSSPPEFWKAQAERDMGRPLLVDSDGVPRTYRELAARPQAFAPTELAREVWERKYQRVQAAVARLAQLMAEAEPDVVLVVGDDQDELFDGPPHPTFAVYSGETITDFPLTPEQMQALPKITQAAAWARHATEVESYVVQADLAEHLIAALGAFGVERIFTQPDGRSVGHAYTFVRLRLQSREKPCPMVPIFVNCLYETNVPTARECIAFGRALREAVECWPSPARVAVVASGGLSHFVVDEALDRSVLTALAENDVDRVADLDQKYLQSGSGEVRNWLVAGGALAGLRMTTIDYVPGYRSEAGTGVGMGFAAWLRDQ